LDSCDPSSGSELDKGKGYAARVGFKEAVLTEKNM
jgi:hypothetical protein